MAPKDTGWLWARGNTATCTASGMLTMVGILLVSFYHCFLSVHFALRVRYQWRSEDITKNLELPAHLLAWVISLAIPIAGIFFQSYNPFVYFCTSSAYPQGCTPDPVVDCERGGQRSYGGVWDESKLIAISMVVVQTILTTIGLTATTLVYCSVREQERRNRRHSFTLPSAVEASDRSMTEDTSKITSMGTLRRPSLIVGGDAISASIARIRSTIRPEQQGGEQSRWKQEVGIQAVLYTIAYLNNYTWPLILNLVYLSMTTDDLQERLGGSGLFWIQLLTAIFFPLQGFWNLFIYLRPRWKAWREVDQNWSSWVVLKKTFSSAPVPRMPRRKSSDALSSTHQAVSAYTCANSTQTYPSRGRTSQRDNVGVSMASAAARIVTQDARDHGENGLRAYYLGSSSESASLEGEGAGCCSSPAGSYGEEEGTPLGHDCSNPCHGDSAEFSTDLLVDIDSIVGCQDNDVVEEGGSNVSGGGGKDVLEQAPPAATNMEGQGEV